MGAPEYYNSLKTIFSCPFLFFINHQINKRKGILAEKIVFKYEISYLLMNPSLGLVHMLFPKENERKKQD